MMKSRIASATLAGLLGLLMSSSARAGIVAAWNFETDAVAVNNGPAADIGPGAASSIGMNQYATPNVGVTTDDVLAGKGSDTGANGIADTTQIWRVRGQAGANGAANGWSSLAPIASQGAVFSASTAGSGAGSITVGFDWYATTQGEANLQLQYTTNGTTWKNIAINIGTMANFGLAALTNTTSTNTVMGSYISDNLLTNGSLAGQDWFTGLTATITDAGALNDSNFAIRMVNASTGADCVSTQGTALNNSSGNWRFDNVSIVANPAAAVPEPSSLALTGLALGVAGLAGVARRRAARA